MHRMITRHTLCGLLFALALSSATAAQETAPESTHPYNGVYTGDNLNYVAFPIGGIGAGMYCLEGSGAIAQVSVRGTMKFFNEPCMFAAVSVQIADGRVAKVLEGPVPDYKIFGRHGTGRGSTGTTYGLPRFENASFLPRFPFATIELTDNDIPLDVTLTGWSPFIPGEADDSSLPVGALEYTFTNPTNKPVEAIFSYNTKNFMAAGGGSSINAIDGGFILHQSGSDDHPEHEGAMAFFITNNETHTDCGWFRGGWWDPLTLAWRNVAEGRLVANPPQKGSSPGASVHAPFTVPAGESHTIRLLTCWYVPKTNLRIGADAVGPAFTAGPPLGKAANQQDIEGYLGNRLINTFNPSGDSATGVLTSPEFTITHDFMQFLIGGGDNPDTTCMQLVIDDEVIRTATGTNQEELLWTTWDLRSIKGKTAHLRIVDKATAAWGHINVDQIILTNPRYRTAKELMRAQTSWGDDTILINDFEANSYGDWKPDCPPGACASGCTPPPTHHIPWYAGKFDSINEVATYWRDHYDQLRADSALFRDTFYDTTLPPEVVEAAAANLTILKSPTVLRQTDGRIWCFEGCNDDSGCCHGSCTHVWNYAQAIPHLFPELERSLRQTEFNESQDERGHQMFRSNIPIRPVAHTHRAAADGQLGGIMKVHREWRISGDDQWMLNLWPLVKKSLDYCINTWDPRSLGVLDEPHHNTYDIEYWGPDGHCSSFYHGALAAAIIMGERAGDDVSHYRMLLTRGQTYLEEHLYNGEYFFQIVQTEGLNHAFHPLNTSANGPGYDDIIAELNEQGPKYQYGSGCLSDGVLGFWMALTCGIDDPIADPAKVRSNLAAIHRYNLKLDLYDHINPQRPSYAMGHEGGLLLCTWPRGGMPALPFVYSDEVWTGIEYQVAAHLMMEGMIEEGLEIVRVCRDRYDGRTRNPFNEYECGHWYARAMSSYALLQGMTGVRYDAVTRTLHLSTRSGATYRTFLSTEVGYGVIDMLDGVPKVEVASGVIPIERIVIDGKQQSPAD